MEVRGCVFFFFQAEDGIRDRLVTGVQTCALPICPHDARRSVVRHVGPTADVGSRARSLRRRVAPDVVLCELLDVGWL